MSTPAVEIRYRDLHVVVADKPSALHVHRTALDPDRDVLLTRVRDAIDSHLYPVHRLDRATSGLVLFALDSSSARTLQECWGSDTVTKEYLALVRGEPPATFSSERPLTRKEDGVRQEARTRFRTLGSDRGFSLVVATLETGRRHQIRRHLAHAGHQIVGDTTYGKGRINRWLREEYGLPRLLLHANRLAFPALDDGSRVLCTAPLPADFTGFLARFSPPLLALARPACTEGGGSGEAATHAT